MKSITAGLFTFLLLASCWKNSSTLGTDSTERIRIKTVHGDIIIELNSHIAPLATARIKQLVQQDFYDGLKFHKVIRGKLIQTGSPNDQIDTGTGVKLKAEISDLPFKRGTVAMDRNKFDLNSADSQFFICLDEIPEFRKQYTIIGTVSSGDELLDKIQPNDKIIQMSED